MKADWGFGILVLDLGRNYNFEKFRGEKKSGDWSVKSKKLELSREIGDWRGPEGSRGLQTSSSAALRFLVNDSV